jgi:hypothetical protein
MRRGKKYADEILSTFSKIESEALYLKSEISTVDKAISDINHELELVKLGTVQAYKIMTKLQELLRKRRELKREYLPIMKLNDTIRGNKIKEKMITAQEGVHEYIQNESRMPEDRGLIKSILEQ